MMRIVAVAWFLVSLLPAETLSVGGRQVFFTSAGKGDTAIVFIHGWAADSSFFEAQTKEFAKRMRVAALDLPGHGKSESPPRMEIDNFVAAVEAIRMALPAKKILLAGHAFGAVVARQYARRHPAQVAGLVFLDGSIFQLPPGEQDRLRWAEGIRRMAQSFGPSIEKQARERGISVFLSNLYTDNTPRDLQMRILRQALATPAASAEGLLLCLADLKLWNDDKLDVPVLALRTGRQQPPGEEQYLQSLFPRIQYKFLPGVSHYLMLEEPEQVNQEMARFLDERKLR